MLTFKHFFERVIYRSADGSETITTSDRPLPRIKVNIIVSKAKAPSHKLKINLPKKQPKPTKPYK